MKPLWSNRHVERILSLIVILYGLRLMIPDGEEIVRCVVASGGWISPIAHLPEWLLVLSNPVIGCLLIVFFPRIVQGIGYFATEGRTRSKRRWFAREILAIPLILYAFTEFLFVFSHGVSAVASVIRYYDVYCEIGWDKYDWMQILLLLPIYATAAAMILFCARRIATWLLRVVE